LNGRRLSLYLHTIRHLRASQVLARLRRGLQSNRVDSRPAAPRRVRNGAFVEPCAGAPVMRGPGRFRFLNVERECNQPQDWQGTADSRLWYYNAHYFDDLNAVGAAERSDWHRALIERWIVQNPSGRGIGWEPYPVARRIVNWIKYDMATGGLSARAVDSLAIQARWLETRLEFHLMGNHLFADAKALVFAGSYFHGEEAHRWFELGAQLVNGQIAEQVLEDGGHFELSPMYHAAFLEDVLDLINVQRASGNPVDARWLAAANSMRRWLRVMTHPDGRIPFFNDAAFAVSPEADELETYALRLGLSALSSPAPPGTDLAASGYVRVDAGPARLICDCAAVGPAHMPGHAHADTLSFELSLFGQRLLVNSGTSTYAVDNERQRQRGTAAHNTVVLDGQDSSEVWGGFRVARRARIVSRTVSLQPQSATVIASHDGYRRLQGRNDHARRWTLDARSLSIEDQVSGRFSRAEAFFHVHPEVRATLTGPATVSLVTPAGSEAGLEFAGADTIALEPSSWHPEFGAAVPACRVVARFTRDRLLTRIAWPAN
jgi:uncharacterized heparinase superfamily protein